MFRMEFHSLDAVEEDEDCAGPCRNEPTRGNSVYEQYRQRTPDSPPKIYEGRVGKLSKLQRVVSSNEAMQTVSEPPPIPITRARSLNLETSIPKNWVEVDLIDFSDSPKAPQQATEVAASAGEQEVIRELVKPFTESVNLTNGVHGIPESQPVIRDLLSNGVEEGEAVVSTGPSSSTASLPVRTDSMRSTNSTSRNESSDTESSNTTGEGAHPKDGERAHLKDEEKGNPASLTINKAFNKFIHHKKNKPTVPENKVVKPWDEPLLLAHEQVKLERKAQKEAKVEAKRQAEEAEREAEIQQRELLELADPVPESSLKHKNDHGVLKGINKLFHIHGGTHSNLPSPRGVHGDVRESKLVMPRAGLFEAPGFSSPSTTDAALAQIRSGPRPVTKSDLTFPTVESHQRDVRPWTMEEYMAKNARLEEWKRRKNDKEFGGIEGNQLLNQFLNDDVFDDFDNFDSDSDF